MSGVRKKWKLAVWTGGGSTEERATGEKAAYARAIELLRKGAAGENRVTSVTVYVNEDGRRWLTFETLRVDEFRASA